MSAHIPCLSFFCLLRFPQLWKSEQLFVDFVVEHDWPVLFRRSLPQHWSITFPLGRQLCLLLLKFHAIGFAEDRVTHSRLVTRIVESSITLASSISDSLRYAQSFLLPCSHALFHSLGKAPIPCCLIFDFNFILSSFYWIIKWASVITFGEISALLAALVNIQREIPLSTILYLGRQNGIFVEIERVYLSHVLLSAPKVGHFDKRADAAGASRNYFL